MKFQDYKHFIPIQLRFSDIDRLQHVNNACYHNFVELGRVSYFNFVFKSAINWEEEGFVLARTEMDHLEQIFLNDEVYCFTAATKLGNKSLQMKSSIVKKTAEGLIEAAAVKGILVAMDYRRNESVPVPDKWRLLLNKYEEKDL